MNLPKKIRVMALDYEVTSMNDQEERASHFLGITYNDEAKMSVDIRHKPQIVAVSFLHEIIHAVVYQMGKFDLDKKKEEEVVDGIAVGLSVVMRDNPKLFPLIQKALK